MPKRKRKAKLSKKRAARTRVSRPSRSTFFSKTRKSTAGNQDRGANRFSRSFQRVRFHQTTNFHHVHLHALAKSLPSLAAVATSLLVLSEPGPKGRKYYLSTPKLLHEALERKPERRPLTSARRLLRIRIAIRRAGIRLPILSMEKNSSGLDLASRETIQRQALLLQVRRGKPVKLVVTNPQGLGAQISSRLDEQASSKLQEALVGAFAAEATVAGTSVGGSLVVVPAEVAEEVRRGKPSAEPARPWGAGAGRKSHSAPPPRTWGGAPDAPAPKAPTERPLGWTSAKPPEHGPDFVREMAPGKEGRESTLLHDVEAGLAVSAGATEPDLTLPVYPNIEVEGRHPVQGDRININVSLEFEQSKITVGFADTPQDTKLHVFDVHLLLGGTSQWKQLEFQRPGGTIKKAEFSQIETPALDGSELEIAGHRYIEVYVNFYLESRWCGEAVQRIEVRPNATSPKAGKIPDPEAPAWRAGLNVKPGTEPPDLLVRIQKTHLGEYEWNLISPWKTFPRGTPKLQMQTPDPYQFVRDHFETFTGNKLNDDDIDALNGYCDFIYQLAPQGFRNAYEDLQKEVAESKGQKKFETIQFVSSEPYIPWELMRMPEIAGENPMPVEILCIRHSVGRWMADSSSRLQNELQVNTIAVSASDYKKQNAANLPPLEWAALELKLLTDKPYNAKEIPLRLPELKDFLRHGVAELVHFSCHGKTEALAADKATLVTEDDEVGLRATTVASKESANGLGASHPLVFLNACQAAAAGNVVGMVFGWPQAFLQMGATACVAPLWKVMDSSARDIAEKFYRATLIGNEGKKVETLGEALREIRSQWKTKKSLTYLGYVLYGDPTTLLSRKTPAQVI